MSAPTKTPAGATSQREAIARSRAILEAKPQAMQEYGPVFVQYDLLDLLDTTVKRKTGRRKETVHYVTVPPAWDFSGDNIEVNDRFPIWRGADRTGSIYER